MADFLRQGVNFSDPDSFSLLTKRAIHVYWDQLPGAAGFVGSDREGLVFFTSYLQAMTGFGPGPIFSGPLTPYMQPAEDRLRNLWLERISMVSQAQLAEQQRTNELLLAIARKQGVRVE